MSGKEKTDVRDLVALQLGAKKNKDAFARMSAERAAEEASPFWRGLSDVLDAITPKSTNEDATKVAKQLLQQFPKEDGWKLRTKFYAGNTENYPNIYTNIDVVAINTRTGAVYPIRLTKRDQPSAYDVGVLSAQKRLLTPNWDYIKRDVEPYAFSLSNWSLTKVQPWEPSRIDAVMGGSVFRKSAPKPAGKSVDYNGFFPAYTGKGTYSPPLVLTDIETSGIKDNAAINQVSAFTVRYNYDTKRLEQVSSYNRYYLTPKELTKTADYETAVAVTGLTNKELLKRRKADKATYGKYYDAKERDDFLNYIGNAKVVGHNAAQFDIPRLLGVSLPANYGAGIDTSKLPFDVIDTYHIAEGTRGDGPGRNKLDTLFHDTYNRSMESVVGKHHDARPDAIAVGLLLEKWVQRKAPGDRIGEVSRYVLSRSGVSTQWRDRMIDSELTEIRIKNGGFSPAVYDPELKSDRNKFILGGKRMDTVDDEFAQPIGKTFHEPKSNRQDPPEDDEIPAEELEMLLQPGAGQDSAPTPTPTPTPTKDQDIFDVPSYKKRKLVGFQHSADSFIETVGEILQSNKATIAGIDPQDMIAGIQQLLRYPNTTVDLEGRSIEDIARAVYIKEQNRLQVLGDRGHLTAAGQKQKQAVDKLLSSWGGSADQQPISVGVDVSAGIKGLLGIDVPVEDLNDDQGSTPPMSDDITYPEVIGGYDDPDVNSGFSKEDAPDYLGMDREAAEAADSLQAATGLKAADIDKMITAISALTTVSREVSDSAAGFKTVNRIANMRALAKIKDDKDVFKVLTKAGFSDTAANQVLQGVQVFRNANEQLEARQWSRRMGSQVNRDWGKYHRTSFFANYMKYAGGDVEADVGTLMQYYSDRSVYDESIRQAHRNARAQRVLNRYSVYSGLPEWQKLQSRLQHNLPVDQSHVDALTTAASGIQAQEKAYDDRMRQRTQTDRNKAELIRQQGMLESRRHILGDDTYGANVPDDVLLSETDRAKLDQEYKQRLSVKSDWSKTDKAEADRIRLSDRMRGWDVKADDPWLTQDLRAILDTGQDVSDTEVAKKEAEYHDILRNKDWSKKLEDDYEKKVVGRASTAAWYSGGLRDIEAVQTRHKWSLRHRKAVNTYADKATELYDKYFWDDSKFDEFGQMKKDAKINFDDSLDALKHVLNKEIALREKYIGNVEKGFSKVGAFVSRGIEAVSTLHSIYQTGWDTARTADQIRQAHVSGLSGAVSDAQPLFMGPAKYLYSPFSRFVNAGSLKMQADWDRLLNKRQEQEAKNQGWIAGGVGAAVTAASTLVGTLISPGAGTVAGLKFGSGAGLAAGTLVSNLMSGSARRKNEQEARSIQAGWEDIRSQINLFSGFAELLTAPLKLAIGGLRLAFGGLRTGINLTIASFSKFVKWMDTISVGLPLTSFNKMGYVKYQYANQTDRLMGFQQGTTHNAVNKWIEQRSSLYTMGKIDTDRMIAAAMLGQFNRVYNPNGGNTEEDYANLLNDYAQRIPGMNATERENTMTLLGKIDDTLPARLQQMLNLGIKDYRVLQDGRFVRSRNMYYRPITEQERNQLNLTQFEWGTAKEQFGISRQRIMNMLWQKFGKNLMNSLNEILDMIVQGDFEGALRRVGELFGQLKTKVLEFLGIDETDILGSLKTKLSGLLSAAIQALSPEATKLGDVLIKAIRRVIEVVGPQIEMLVDYIKGIKLQFHVDTSDKFHPKVDLDIQTPYSSLNMNNKIKYMSNEQRGKMGGILGRLKYNAYEDTDEEGTMNFTDQWKLSLTSRVMGMPEKGARSHWNVVQNNQTGVVQPDGASVHNFLNRVLVDAERHGVQLTVEDVAFKIWDEVLKADNKTGMMSDGRVTYTDRYGNTHYDRGRIIAALMADITAELMQAGSEKDKDDQWHKVFGDWTSDGTFTKAMLEFFDKGADTVEGVKNYWKNRKENARSIKEQEKLDEEEYLQWRDQYTHEPGTGLPPINELSVPQARAIGGEQHWSVLIDDKGNKYTMKVDSESGVAVNNYGDKSVEVNPYLGAAYAHRVVADYSNGIS